MRGVDKEFNWFAKKENALPYLKMNHYGTYQVVYISFFVFYM